MSSKNNKNNKSSGRPNPKKTWENTRKARWKSKNKYSNPNKSQFQNTSGTKYSGNLANFMTKKNAPKTNYRAESITQGKGGYMPNSVSPLDMAKAAGNFLKTDKMVNKWSNKYGLGGGKFAALKNDPSIVNTMNQAKSNLANWNDTIGKQLGYPAGMNTPGGVKPVTNLMIDRALNVGADVNPTHGMSLADSWKSESYLAPEISGKKILGGLASLASGIPGLGSVMDALTPEQKTDLAGPLLGVESMNKFGMPSKFDTDQGLHVAEYPSRSTEAVPSSPTWQFSDRYGGDPNDPFGGGTIALAPKYQSELMGLVGPGTPGFASSGEATIGKGSLAEEMGFANTQDLNGDGIVDSIDGALAAQAYVQGALPGSAFFTTDIDSPEMKENIANHKAIIDAKIAQDAQKKAASEILAGPLYGLDQGSMFDRAIDVGQDLYNAIPSWDNIKDAGTNFMDWSGEKYNDAVDSIMGPISFDSVQSTPSQSEILDAIAWVESRNDPTAIGAAGELGEFQIKPSTALDAGHGIPSYEGDPSGLHDSDIARMVAGDILGGYTDALGGDWEKGVIGYNTGVTGFNNMYGDDGDFSGNEYLNRVKDALNMQMAEVTNADLNAIKSGKMAGYGETEMPASNFPGMTPDEYRGVMDGTITEPGEYKMIDGDLNKKGWFGKYSTV